MLPSGRSTGTTDRMMFDSSGSWCAMNLGGINREESRDDGVLHIGNDLQSELRFPLSMLR